MNAPLSDHIVKVLQDDQSTNKLVEAILKERTLEQPGFITIQVGSEVKTYKRITNIKR